MTRQIKAIVRHLPKSNDGDARGQLGQAGLRQRANLAWISRCTHTQHVIQSTGHVRGNCNRNAGSVTLAVANGSTPWVLSSADTIDLGPLLPLILVLYGK